MMTLKHSRISCGAELKLPFSGLHLKSHLAWLLCLLHSASPSFLSDSSEFAALMNQGPLKGSQPKKTADHPTPGWCLAIWITFFFFWPLLQMFLSNHNQEFTRTMDFTQGDKKKPIHIQNIPHNFTGFWSFPKLTYGPQLQNHRL